MEPPDAIKSRQVSGSDDEVYFVDDDNHETNQGDELESNDDTKGDLEFLKEASSAPSEEEDSEWKKTTLSAALEHQLFERNAKFSRKCPICGVNPFTEEGEVHLRDMFSHMFTEHHFNMGHPDNLVFVPDLLDLLEKSISQLRCIYCEKVFKTRQILKEHMRKKRHIRIHPKNPRYDRFYILNYSTSGFLPPSTRSSGHDQLNDANVQDTNDEDEENWEDWIDEDADHPKMRCLLCEQLSEGKEKCLSHMVEKHHFDLSELRRTHQLDFYSTVRLINYIRRHTSQTRCALCLSDFGTQSDFLEHIYACKAVPSLEFTKDDTLLVPVLADDNLLTSLIDSDSEDE